MTRRSVPRAYGATVAYPGSPYRGRRPLLTPALTTDGILFHRSQVLLIRRRRPPWEGMWALPGGFVKIGESAEEAVVREFHEETSVRTQVAGLVGVYSSPSRDPRAHIVTIAYVLRRWSGSPRARSDARDVRWWPTAALPSLAADHAEILADALRGARTPGRRRSGRHRLPSSTRRTAPATAGRAPRPRGRTSDAPRGL